MAGEAGRSGHTSCIEVEGRMMLNPGPLEARAGCTQPSLMWGWRRSGRRMCLMPVDRMWSRGTWGVLCPRFTFGGWLAPPRPSEASCPDYLASSEDGLALPGGQRRGRPDTGPAGRWLDGLSCSASPMKGEGLSLTAGQECGKSVLTSCTCVPEHFQKDRGEL